MQKKWWVFGSFFLFVLLFFLFEIGKKEKVITVDRAVEQDYIKWVDFKVTCEAMKEAYEYDVQSWNEEVHLPWIELLAYLGAKYGGDFSHYKQKDMEEIAQKLREGEVTIQELKKEIKYFSYYLEAYGAVLGGMVGEYEIEREEEGEKKWEKIYGLKAFSPIPKGFPYSDYYAHLRQNYPYAENLKEGDIVTGGDIIGYMGHTGYSKKENVNNIDQVHLHWGLQLIFHESQKEGSNEIWISCYELMKFLRQNQVEAKKVEGTKEWKRTFEMKDLNVAHP